MNFYRLIKSKTFLFGIIILTAYIVISAIIYNSVILKMENDMNADNNIQLGVIKLSDSIRLTVSSAQDVVHFSRKNDKKRLKSSLLKLSALIGLTNKRFEEFNKNLKKFPFLEKTVLPFENKAYYNWKNLIVPILVTLIIHHKIMAKSAFMEPLFISMYKAGPNYAPLMEQAFCILQIIFPQNCKQNSPLLQRKFPTFAKRGRKVFDPVLQKKTKNKVAKKIKLIFLPGIITL